jgi:hypothetical protein
MSVKFPPVSVPKSQATARPADAAAPPAGAAPATKQAAAESPPSAQQQTLTIDLPGIGTKTYNFPTKFHQVEMLKAEMLLKTDDVKKWLPSGMEPASTAGVTKGLVTFQHMGKPEQMEPYDEAQFAVRVKGPDGQEGWHVLDMPVNSFENKQRGQFIFGYPKEMAQVGIQNSTFGRVGTAKSESGDPMFSLSVGPRLPFGFHKAVDNDAFQSFNGEVVHLHSTAEGKAAPGLGRVTFSDAMRARFPGLPENPVVTSAGRLTDGELALGLPQKTGVPSQ